MQAEMQYYEYATRELLHNNASSSSSQMSFSTASSLDHRPQSSVLAPSGRHEYKGATASDVTLTHSEVSDQDAEMQSIPFPVYADVPGANNNTDACTTHDNSNDFLLLLNREASGHNDENDVIRTDSAQKDCPRDQITHDATYMQDDNVTTTVEAVVPGWEDHRNVTDWGSSLTFSGGNAAACPNTATNSGTSTHTGPLLSASEVLIFHLQMAGPVRGIQVSELEHETGS